jgi:peroxiredoxin
MQVKKWLVAGAVAACAAVAAVVVLGTGASAAPQSTFVLLDGSRQTTQDLRGKVALVNFWATSCTTCVAEMPEIVATYDKFKDRGFETLAVAMSYDPPSYVVNFTETRKLPFKVAIDNTGDALHFHRQQARGDREELRGRPRFRGAAQAHRAPAGRGLIPPAAPKSKRPIS